MSQESSPSTVVKVGAVVGAIVLLVALSVAVASFVLGDGESTQSNAESTVQEYYRGIETGDENRVVATIHDDSPFAREMAGGPAGLSLEPADREITVVDSEIVDQTDEWLVLEVELERTERDGDSTTEPVQVELRPEDGEWKLWYFLDR